MNGFASLIASVSLIATPAAENPSDYYGAYSLAASQQKLLLVDFGTSTTFESSRPEHLERHVVCHLPIEFRLPGDDRQRLIDHSSFRPLAGKPGLAVVDLTGGPHHGDVVSVLPQRHCSPEEVAALLALPAGTLTQRTLCWAFMIHPEHPQSVYGAACPQLMEHCARHSARQAAMNNQHHDMNHPGRAEIVAESWPWNKNIVDAAIDIVGSWRQSPGHWGAAHQAWNRFGYDMKSNGEKWFATGVFQ